MTRLKELGLVLLTAAVIFFALQNLHDVEVAFLWLDGSLPLSIITLVPLLVGLLVGAGTAIVVGHRRGKRERERARAIQGSVGETGDETEAGEAAAEDEPGRLPSGQAGDAGGREPTQRAGSERSM